jgi:cytidylate kinase
MRIVAVDGPSGAGKSTVSRALAARLDLDVLDTGAMYRAVTLAALEAGLALDDGAALGALAERLVLDVGDRVRLDGRDVTAEIRGPEVTAAVSTVSAHPQVRSVLVERQRAWASARGGGVVEGRDIGTVVFPDAPLKVFLVASEEERARRRHHDESAAARATDIGRVAEELARRDRLDQSRATSPLAAAEDAVVVDTTDRMVDDVVDELVALARQRFAAAVTADAEQPG